MLLITITALLVVIERTNSGYISPRLSVTSELPTIESNLLGDIEKRMQDFLPKQTVKTEVPHTVQYQNYYDYNSANGELLTDNVYESKIFGGNVPLFATVNQQNQLSSHVMSSYSNPVIRTPSVKLTAPLKFHQSSLADSTGNFISTPVLNIPIKQSSIGNLYSYVNIPTLPTLNSPLKIKEQSNFDVNTVQGIEISTGAIPNINTLTPLENQNNLEFNSLKNIDIPYLKESNVNELNLEQLQTNLELTTQHHVIQQDGNTNLDSPIYVQKGVTPEITKHIYFHVPPPEIEEPPVRTLTPKIKDYKIIFIKVPSQERKYISQLQENAINQVAQTEEKTIIYVLSKKPTSPEVLSSKPVPSHHEVFFVKYNGDTGTAINQISDNLEQLDSSNK